MAEVPPPAVVKDIAVFGGITGIAANTADMEVAASLVRSAATSLDDALAQCAHLLTGLALCRVRAAIGMVSPGHDPMVALHLDHAVDGVDLLMGALRLCGRDLDTLATGTLDAAAVYGEAEAQAGGGFLDVLGGLFSIGGGMTPGAGLITAGIGAAQSGGTSWKDNLAGGVGAFVGRFQPFRNPFSTPGIDDAAGVIRFGSGLYSGTIGGRQQPMDLRPGHLVERTVMEQPLMSPGQAGHALAEVASDEHPPGTVMIQKITQPDGTETWAVLIPGTKDWAPGSAQPFDLDGNLDLMSGRRTDGMQMVEAAMQQAGIPVGARVGFYGHSQGGITAMALADDPVLRRRYDLQSVTTYGSPVSRMELSDPVPTLHLENTSEVVTSLDAAGPPDAVDRVTISAEVSGLGVIEAHDPRTHAQVLHEAVLSGDAAVLHAVEQQSAVLHEEQFFGSTAPRPPDVETMYFSPAPPVTPPPSSPPPPVCAAPGGPGPAVPADELPRDHPRGTRPPLIAR